jgi:tetratricopeptide (TPR) repeat protein
MMWLGRPVLAQGRVEEAIDLQRRALEIALKTRGKQSPIYISGAGELGAALTAGEQYEEAERYTRESLDLALQLYGEDDLRTATAQCRVADVLRRTGRVDGARRYYEAALWTRRKRLPAGDPRIAEVESALDACRGESGKQQGSAGDQ